LVLLLFFELQPQLSNAGGYTKRTQAPSDHQISELPLNSTYRLMDGSVMLNRLLRLNFICPLSRRLLILRAKILSSYLYKRIFFSVFLTSGPTYGVTNEGKKLLNACLEINRLKQIFFKNMLFKFGHCIVSGSFFCGKLTLQTSGEKQLLYLLRF
jgi:hypothetical protein